MPLETAERDYLNELASRRGGRAAATIGEIFSAEWRRAGLDTVLGVGQPFSEAYEDLRSGIEREAGEPIDDLARRTGINMGRAATRDQRIAILGELADSLPEEARKRLEPLKDVRRRASEKAQAIEREAAEIHGAAYGLSGTATSFAAGLARHTVDLPNLVAMVATAPIGGPATAIVRQAAAAGISQAAVEPYIQAVRAELKLEHGFSKALGDVGEAAIGAGALAALFRGAGLALRLARPARPRAEPMAEHNEPAYLNHELLEGLPFDQGGPVAEVRGVFSDLPPFGGEFDIATGARARPTRTREPPPPEDRSRTALYAEDLSGFDQGRPIAEVRGVGSELLPFGGEFAAGGARARPDRSRQPDQPPDLGRTPLFFEEDLPFDRGGPLESPLSLAEAGGRSIGEFDIKGALDRVTTEELLAVARLMERDHLIDTARPAAEAKPGEAPKPPAPEQVAADRAKVNGARQAMEEGIPIPPEAEPPPPAPGQGKKWGPGVKHERHWSLFEYLAERGGIAFDQSGSSRSGEIAGMFGGGRGPFVPGFGPLLRKGGMTLEDAVQAAKEGRYLFDPADFAEGERLVGIDDLLALMDREARGDKQYRQGDGGPFIGRAQEAEIRAQNREQLELERTARASAFDGRMKALKITEVTAREKKRALQIMEKEGIADPLLAYEQALMEHATRTEKIRAKRQEQLGEIPGWDVDPDARPAPRPGEDVPGEPGARPGEPQPGGEPRPGGEGARAQTETRLGDPASSEVRAGSQEIGDPILAADAERALAEHGDLIVEIPNPAGGPPRRITFREALEEVKSDAKAAAELRDCIGALKGAAE